MLNYGVKMNMKEIKINGMRMKGMKRLPFFIFLFGIFGLLVIAGCGRGETRITGNIAGGGVNDENDGGNSGIAVDKIKIYRSNSCGCCSLYSSYVKGKGNNVEDNMLPNIDFIKQQYNIPASVQSCHTSIIGKYFVEGHVPLEAVAKMMREQPDILGIGMPGMPSGSPGMPGAKQGDFVVYGVNKDGSTYEFMRL